MLLRDILDKYCDIHHSTICSTDINIKHKLISPSKEIRKCLGPDLVYIETDLIDISKISVGWQNIWLCVVLALPTVSL